MDTNQVPNYLSGQATTPQPGATSASTTRHTETMAVTHTGDELVQLIPIRELGDAEDELEAERAEFKRDAEA